MKNPFRLTGLFLLFTFRLTAQIHILPLTDSVFVHYDGANILKTKTSAFNINNLKSGLTRRNPELFRNKALQLDSIKYTKSRLDFYYSLSKNKKTIDSVAIISKKKFPANLYTYYNNILQNVPVEEVWQILKENFPFRIDKIALVKVNNKNVLFVKTDYRPQNSLNGFIGFSSRDNKPDWHGNFQLALRNIFHLDERLSLHVQSVRETKFLTIGITFPFIGGSRWEQGTSVSIVKTADQLTLTGDLRFGYRTRHHMLGIRALRLHRNTDSTGTTNTLTGLYWKFTRIKHTSLNVYASALTGTGKTKFLKVEFRYDLPFRKRFYLEHTGRFTAQSGIGQTAFYPLPAFLQFLSGQIDRAGNLIDLTSLLILRQKQNQPFIFHRFMMLSGKNPGLVYTLSAGAGLRIGKKGQSLDIALAYRYLRSENIDYQPIMLNINFTSNLF